MTDADGHSRQVRLPLHFLVNDSEVLFYRTPDGTKWTVGRAPDGQYYKQRFL